MCRPCNKLSWKQPGLNWGSARCGLLLEATVADGPLRTLSRMLSPPANHDKRVSAGYGQANGDGA
jgi:hypothetical protein